MSKFTVNESFTLQIPDSFLPMSREDMNRVYPDAGPDCWGVWDRENHVMITVLWKRYPSLLSRMADLKSMAKRNEQLTGRGYAGHSYRLLEYLSLQAGELQAEGYRFTYRMGDISQAADTVLVRHGKLVYSLSCIGREENAAADRASFRAVLGSLEVL